MKNFEFVKKNNIVNQKLYKYFSNLNYVESSIKNDEIHFEKLDTYNDIFDGSFVQDIELIKKISNKNNTAFKFFIDLFKKTEYKNYIEQIEQNYSKEYQKCNNLEEVVKKAHSYIGALCKVKSIKSFYGGILNQLGGQKRNHYDNLFCTCFSEVNDSLLMWGYYAKEHQGICIEYNLTNSNIKGDNKIINNIHKVAYTTNYTDGSAGLDYLFFKSIEWSHEQEWRIICEIKNKEKSLPFPYISAIYLGARISEEDEKRFVKLGKEYNLKVYKMIPSLSKYEIEAHEIEL